jgi:hypothetical protein
MLIRNATGFDIGKALEDTNLEFDSNIKFKRFDYAGQTREGYEKHNVTLTVKDSKASGSRVSRNGRRISAACWHVHGTFMDALPNDAVIISLGRKISPDDYWHDWRIGPGNFYMSESCDC